MTKIAIITVSATDKAHRLHPDDAEVAGIYAVALGDGPGEYSPEPRTAPAPGDDPLVEAALDAFHDRIAISVVDQFEVDVAILAKDDEGPEEAHWV